MTDSNLLELAKLGDPQAIETLMNQSLQSRGMRATVDRQGDDLEVILEAERIPNRQALTAFVQKGISNLGIQSIRSIRILGQQVGASDPAWMQELQLNAPFTPAVDAAPLNIQPEIQPETSAEIRTQPEAENLLEIEEDPGVGDPEPSLSDAQLADISLPDLEEPLDQFDLSPSTDLESLDPLEAGWSEQTSATPDFLQELLAEAPAASTDIPEESDEGLLDFLNDLSGTPANEDFPTEATQDQTVFEDSTELPTDAEFEELFSESSTAELPTNDVSGSDFWMDTAEAPAGEPDADLLDFLNEPVLEPVETFDQSSDLSSGLFGESAASPLADLAGSTDREEPAPTEFPEAASLDQLPDLYGDSTDPETPLEQPSEEFFSALLGESPMIESPLDSEFNPEDDPNASELDSQIEDLFASEADTPVEPFIEESWPEQPPAGDEDLQQALVSDFSPELSTSDTEAIREPWLEGTEDVVLGVPEGEEIQPDAVPFDLFADQMETEPNQPESNQPEPNQLELDQTGLPRLDISEAQTVLDLPDDEEEEITQPWQSPEPSVPEEPLTGTDLTAADFSLTPPNDVESFWFDQDSDADVDVEEIPPDFLLEFQDEPEFSDFLPAPEPYFQPQPLSEGQTDETIAEEIDADETTHEPPLKEFSEFPDDFLVEPVTTSQSSTAAFADLEPSTSESASDSFPSLADLPSLEEELAALELSPPPQDSFSDASNPSIDPDLSTLDSEPFPDDFANFTFDQPDAELADLLSETPEGTVLESSPVDFPEPPASRATAPVEESPDLPLPRPDLVIDEEPISNQPPNVSQTSLEEGLGEFREGFVEPMPAEFFDDANQRGPTDWQSDLRDPLELDGDDSEAGYIIEDNPPEYTPPPLPPQPGPVQPPAAESQGGPPWLFTTVLVALCVLIGGLLGFSLFWSRVAPPPSPPPADEPPAAEPPPPAPSPASPTSANPASPVAESADPNALNLAIDRASDAVTLSQAAQSVDDWSLVASKWQQAIGLLRSVPNSSPDYAAAQQKLADYQANLATAQRKANQPIVAAVPLGQANIKAVASPSPSPTGSPAAAVTCNPVASTPTSQPVELSRVQFDPGIEQAEASSIVGCITNHTEQPIASVDVAYRGNAPTENSPTETTGKLNFAQLNPKQTVPFRSEFTVVPAVRELTIASVSWTATGETEAEQLPTSISVVRPNEEG